MRELTLEELSPYFPYRLKVNDTVGNYFVKGYTDFKGEIRLKLLLKDEPTKETFYTPKIEMCKPTLRPLSDLLDKFGEIEGFSLSDMITHGAHNKFWTVEKFNINHLYIHDLKLLLKHHFDVFRLIDAGLAIDKNTI